MCVCVCPCRACVRVCARVRACVRVCVRAFECACERAFVYLLLSSSLCFVMSGCPLVNNDGVSYSLFHSSDQQ